MQMLGSCLELFDHELQEPAETDSHCTTNPPQRDALQQESFNEETLLRGDHVIARIEDKSPATQFTSVILFPSMDMAISFILW